MSAHPKTQKPKVYFQHWKKPVNEAMNAKKKEKKNLTRGKTQLIHASLKEKILIARGFNWSKVAHKSHLKYILRENYIILV